MASDLAMDAMHVARACSACSPACELGYVMSGAVCKSGELKGRKHAREAGLHDVHGGSDCASKNAETIPTVAAKEATVPAQANLPRSQRSMVASARYI